METEINIAEILKDKPKGTKLYADAFGELNLERVRYNVPKGNIPSDKQKCQPKAQHEFTIKGVKIIAASKKDAIKKYNHRKK